MYKLQIPRQQKWVKDSYYRAYYESVKRSAIYAGMQVEITITPKVWCCPKNAFSATLNGQQFIMDYSDLKPLQLNPSDYNCPYFKWHYSFDYPKHSAFPNVYPLCVLQDYDWQHFQEMRKKIVYTAKGSVITNNQRPRAAAKGRRSKVQSMLTKRYGKMASVNWMPQDKWWLLHEKALVSVAVPGARNDMLDRGQWELMGLGVCVISPEIVTMLAGRTALEPYKHYLVCDGDYSNLLDMVEWCHTHREECAEIGRSAKKLFNWIGPPVKYWKYIAGVLHG